MARLRIFVVGRTRAPFLEEGESFYLKRLRRYAQVEWVEIKPVPVSRARSSKEILDSEGERIRKKVGPRDYVIALDRSGLQYDSEALAKWMGDLSINGGRTICFVTGGPLGLSKSLLDQADRVLSLSKLTLTHEMSRLLLLEQIYRAFTILRGEKYHK